MKCPACQSAELVVATETIQHPALPSAVLVGVEVSRCPACGEWIQRIPRVEDLDRLIARLLIKKPGPLDRTEFRFLRKWLGLSGRDLAQVVNRTPETIYRYEGGDLPIAPEIDKLLRLLVANHEPVESYPIGTLARIDFTKTIAKSTPKLEFVRGAWHPLAA